MSNFWIKEKQDLLKTYLQSGMTFKQIAIKLNSTYDAVGNAVKRYNLGEFRVIKPAAERVAENLDLELLDDSNFEELKKQAKLQWKITKSSIPNNKEKPFKTYLVTTDHHIPHHNKAALKAVFKIMDDNKFDGNIILGDFMDMGCISHHNKGKNKTLELQRLKSDYILGNSILDEYSKRLPKNVELHYLMGNHEEWSKQLLEEMPVLEGLIEPESQLFLKERGYKVHQYNDIVSFGRLNLTHGIYAGANPVKKHIDSTHANIMHGHVHTVAMACATSPVKTIALVGYSVGALCDLNPGYMRNKPNGWVHGYAVIQLFKNGYFDVDLKRIIEGRTIFNGKLYDGN